MPSLEEKRTADARRRWPGVTAVVAALAVFFACSIASAAQVRVLRADDDGVLLEYRVDEYSIEAVDAGGASMQRVTCGDEAPTVERGAPELPSVTRSLAIAGDARVEPFVLEAEYEEIENVDVMPSRGIIYRTQNPSSVPYEKGPVYGRDEIYPAELVEVGEPYIMREVRGAVVDLHPFRYNPATRTLRVYRRVVVEIAVVGPAEINPLLDAGRHPSAAFERIYRNHFLNRGSPPAPSRYPAVEEEGELLIICHDDWISNVEPLAAYKVGVGIPTEIVGVSSIGNSATAISDHIRSAYDDGNLAFVLLVGDAAQVATPSSSGGESDPSYSKVAGSDDYPDILVGRFSAETAAEVDTQVQRTIEYETLPATLQDWFRRGTGIGSNEGPGDDNEMDWEHVDAIRDDLLAYGYELVDQIYDPGASASEVTSALNEGRGIVNYTGHGSSAGWGTTGFSSQHVDALSNGGMLPFVFSVACVNGSFSSGTCFAESWLRATDGGQPSGAIGIYASSVNQSWNPPMAAQDESNDLLIAEAHFSFGALCFAGSALMIDEYGAGGVEMFDTWHVFGDPSVRVFGQATPASGLSVDPVGGQSFIGDAGGPFSPEEHVYTLTNNGDETLDFEVSAGQPWLSVEPISGSLGAEEEAQVVLRTTAEAFAMTNGHHDAVVLFENTTDGEGTTERTITLNVGIPEAQYEWPLDSDPGWSADSGWEFGVPGGLGGEHGPPDPDSGHSGQNVYGYNLQGDYPPNLPQRHLTSGPIDCSELTDVSLVYWRWLGVETPQYDHAYVRVSDDGVGWQTVWENGSEVSDGAWTRVEHDLSEVADGSETVYLRWTMGTTDQGWQYCGWNIDDVAIWGAKKPDCSDADGDGSLPPYCGGDDCDDEDPDVNPGAAEICDDGVDNDCDGLTDEQDPDCAGSGTDSDTRGGIPYSPPSDSGCGCAAAGADSSSGHGPLELLVGYLF